MARCTKEEALETRRRILDAAEAVFHAQGVARTSLADVAEAANVTRGAIYWHFKNKGDLFVAMCERVRLPMETMIEATVDKYENDPLGKFRMKCVFLFNDAMNNPHSRKVFDIVYHKCEFVDAKDPIMVRQHECYQRGMTNIEKMLANAIEKGQLPRNLDIRQATIMLHATVVGLMNNWLFSPSSFDLLKDGEILIDICLNNLRSGVPSLKDR